MELFWPILTATFVAFIIYYLFTKEDKFNEYGIPTPNRWSYSLNTIKAIWRTFSVVDNIQFLYDVNKDAKYVGVYEFNRQVIILRDVELIKSITVKNFDHFVDHRSFIDPEMDPLFGNNLSTLRGDKWRELRSLLSPAFTSSKMKSMFKLMSQCAETFTNYIVEQSSIKSIEVDSKEIFTRYTNDTIATCAFGVAVDSMGNPNNEFYVFGKKATTLSMFKFIINWLFPNFAKFFQLKVIPKDVENFFYRLIRDTIAERDEKGIVRPDMLQLMMETRGNKPGSKNPELSIESMTAQAFLFFFGGFDSTSTAMCFAVHEIAANPAVQEKLQREIDEVYEKYNGDPTYDAVQSMEYLDAVINESLRMYPIGAMADRECTIPFELPPTLPGAKTYTINVGDNVWIPIWPIHRNPEFYPEPDKFMPERFLGDSKHNVNPLYYLPFGVGPRMCIGNRFALLEIKVLLLHILHKCNITIPAKVQLPLKISSKNVNLGVVGGFWTVYEPRKK